MVLVWCLVDRTLRVHPESGDTSIDVGPHRCAFEPGDSVLENSNVARDRKVTAIG